MKPSLPQNDLNPEQRKDHLNRQQKAYLFDYEALSPLALLKDVPAVEQFSSKYIGERILATSELPGNMLAADARTFLDPLDELEDYEDFFTLLPLPQVAKIYQRLANVRKDSIHKMTTYLTKNHGEIVIEDLNIR